jgi:hypothetical protein
MSNWGAGSLSSLIASPPCIRLLNSVISRVVYAAFEPSLLWPAKGIL